MAQPAAGQTGARVTAAVRALWSQHAPAVVTRAALPRSRLVHANIVRVFGCTWEPYVMVRRL